MDKPEIVWQKLEEHLHGESEKAYLGKWCVGGFHADYYRVPQNQERYVMTCALPGIKARLGKVQTDTLARAWVEGIVLHWLKNALEYEGPGKAEEEKEG